MADAGPRFVPVLPVVDLCDAEEALEVLTAHLGQHRAGLLPDDAAGLVRLDRFRQALVRAVAATHAARARPTRGARPR